MDERLGRRVEGISFRRSRLVTKGQKKKKNRKKEREKKRKGKKPEKETIALLLEARRTWKKPSIRVGRTRGTWPGDEVPRHLARDLATGGGGRGRRGHGTPRIQGVDGPFRCTYGKPSTRRAAEVDEATTAGHCPTAVCTRSTSARDGEQALPRMHFDRIAVVGRRGSGGRTSRARRARTTTSPGLGPAAAEVVGAGSAAPVGRRPTAGKKRDTHGAAIRRGRLGRAQSGTSITVDPANRRSRHPPNPPSWRRAAVGRLSRFSSAHPTPRPPSAHHMGRRLVT